MISDILIVSDVHGRRARLDELISYRKSLLKEGEVLNVIFLGDGLEDLFASSHYDSIITYAVRGNCDYNVIYSPMGEKMPFTQLVLAGGYKIFITHGHLFSVKESALELCREASSVGADIVLFGHTHVPRLEYIKGGSVRGVDKDIVIFNPGSLDAYDGSFGNLSFSEQGFLLSHGKYTNIPKK